MPFFPPFLQPCSLATRPHIHTHAPLPPSPPRPQVLCSLPVQRLKRSTLFVDVLSVKEFPKRLLLRQLPREVDILCTHPMFGPDSGGWRTGSNMRGVWGHACGGGVLRWREELVCPMLHGLRAPCAMPHAPC